MRPSAVECDFLHAPKNVPTENILTKRNNFGCNNHPKTICWPLQTFVMKGKWKSESCNSESLHLRTGAATKRYPQILVCRLGMPTRYADWVCRLGMPTGVGYLGDCLTQYNGARPYEIMGNIDTKCAQFVLILNAPNPRNG